MTDRRDRRLLRQAEGHGRRTANEKARELLTRYGLGDWIDKKCEAMSKGMGQKVQVLGTIIHDPELVILDEPFSGLDPVNRDTMRDLILDMKRQGRTVIFSTHGMEQREQLCDFVMMIHKSRLQFDGTLADIKKGRDFGIQLDYDGDGSVLQHCPCRAHQRQRQARRDLPAPRHRSAAGAALAARPRHRDALRLQRAVAARGVRRTVEEANGRIAAATPVEPGAR
jgi:ABC-type uncharacterized transport system ATPase subunit